MSQADNCSGSVTIMTLLQVPVERFQALLPEAIVTREPVTHLEQWRVAYCRSGSCGGILPACSSGR
jgi:hypothetical protein